MAQYLGRALPIHNIGLHVRHTYRPEPVILRCNAILDLYIVIVKDEGNLDLDDERHQETIAQVNSETERAKIKRHTVQDMHACRRQKRGYSSPVM